MVQSQYFYYPRLHRDRRQCIVVGVGAIVVAVVSITITTTVSIYIFVKFRWALSICLDKQLGVDSPTKSEGRIRARSKSLVNSVGRLKRISSFSGTIPR